MTISDAERLLKAIEPEGAKIEFRILEPQGESNKATLIKQFQTADVEKAYSFVKSKNWDREHHVFFGVLPRPLKKRSVHVLWADFDGKDFTGGKTQAFVAATESLLLKPTALVDSGHGYHAYWLLSSKLSKAQAQEIMGSMEDFLGSDTVSDPTRFLRLPGTENPKDPPAPCEVRELNPSLSYEPDDFRAVISLSGKARDKIRSGDARGYKSRSERDWYVVNELLKVGASKELIAYLFDAWPVGAKVQDSHEDYLDITIAKARESQRRDQVDSQREVSFFIKEDDTLWISRKDQNPHCVASFWFEPERVIERDQGDLFEGTIHAHNHAWPGEQLEKHSFDSVRSLKSKLRLGAWRWLGSDKEAQHYLGYIVEKLQNKGMPRAQGVIAIGRHEDHWVAPEMTFTEKEVFSLQTSEKIFIQRGIDYPKVNYTFESSSTYRPLCQKIFKHLPHIDNPSALWSIVGWVFATPLKPIFNEVGIRFPHLDLYGSRGSGKTTTMKNVFLPLLGSEEPTYHDCHTTPFVLLGLFSSTNAFPILLAEFHRSHLPESTYNRLVRTLKMAYDSGYDSRGRPNQTVEVYPLSAPIVLDGEDSLSDPALLERTIIVGLSPEDVIEGTRSWKAYRELVKLPLHKFAGNFVRFTLGYDEEDVLDLYERSRDTIMSVYSQPLPDRVRNNLVVDFSGLLLLKQFAADVGFDLPTFDEAFLRGIYNPVLNEVVEFGGGRTRLLVDDFIEDIVNEFQMSIENNRNTGFFTRYDSDERVLWFHLATANNWWYAQRRRRGLPVLDSAALKRQIQERDMTRRDAAGQYIQPSRSLRIANSAKWCYGVDITQAREAGLDIPDKLGSTKQLIVNIRERE